MNHHSAPFADTSLRPNAMNDSPLIWMLLGASGSLMLVIGFIFYLST